MKLKLVLMLGILGFGLTSCNNVESKPTDNNGSNQSQDNESSNSENTDSSNTSEDEVVLNVLEFNDLHGHIEQDNGMYGLSNAAYLVDEIRNEDNLDNTILLANGDMFQETAIARLSYGRVVVDCMNAMDFDMMNLGNHEFDWTLDKCLEFWDNDLTNGEASFPLLNSNVFGPTGELVVDSDRNILPSTIIEREGIKVGIIGLIGDVYSSILASMSADYTFKASAKAIQDITLAEGKKLKDNGADVILVSIHGANIDSIYQYDVNDLLAELTYNNEYLIDAVINGHTHTEQKGLYPRENAAPMAAIQSRLFYSNSGNLDSFGRIDLTVDKDTKKVTKAEVSHVEVKSAGTNYNKEVQDIIDSYYDASRDILDEVYCNNERSFKRQKQAGEWVCNLGMAKTDATACLINNGGLRGEVPTGMIGFKEIYNFNPFDNRLILMDIRGYDLKRFIDRNGSHYFYTTDTGYIDENKTYKLAVIDYVFYSKYFDKYRTNDFIQTDIILRDLMIEELRYYNNSSFNIYEDYNNIHI